MKAKRRVLDTRGDGENRTFYKAERQVGTMKFDKFDKFKHARAPMCGKLRAFLRVMVDPCAKISTGDYIPCVWTHSENVIAELGFSERTYRRRIKQAKKEGWLIPVSIDLNRYFYVLKYPEEGIIFALNRAVESIWSHKNPAEIIADKIDKLILKLEDPAFFEKFSREKCHLYSAKLALAKAPKWHFESVPPILVKEEIKDKVGTTIQEICTGDDFRARVEEEEHRLENEGGIFEISQFDRDEYERKHRPKRINTKTKKAAHKYSKAPKEMCKIEKILGRLKTPLTQKQITELVRIWAHYKPELALPHLEKMLVRFNAGKWCQGAQFNAWRIDGLVWHDSDRGRYRPECHAMLDAESASLVEAERARPKRKYKKKEPVWKPEATLKTWKVTLTFAEADEFEELEETHLVTEFNKSDAITSAKHWHDRTPIKTAIMEMKDQKRAGRYLKESEQTPQRDRS